jgi:hypothetical protein
MYGSGKFEPAPAPPVPQLCASKAVFFLPVQHQLDRKAGLLRQTRADESLGVRRELAAEPAAHVLRDHPDVCCGNLERLRVAVAAAVDGLRGHPRGQLVAVPLTHGAMGLEAHMRDDVRGIGLLDDVRGLLEARIEVAGLLRGSGPGVAAHEDNGRVGRHRLLHVGEVRQGFVAHAHHPGGVFRALFRVGRHRGNRFTLEHAFGSRILPGQGNLHPGRLLRRGQVDRHHARVRQR